MMLPRHNPHIRVTELGGQVEVTYGPRRWSFPAGDCVLLPIANTTAELLARYLAGRLRAALADRFHFHPTLLRVEVEESPGQAAAYEEMGGAAG
jgi:6-pyruvoyltetrahydropterin/6-carboxytetrahydropterin synthase